MPEAELVGQSYFSWMSNALGPYAILLPLAGLICFLLALILVLRGKGPMAAAGLILVAHVPLLIGVFAAIQGGIASYTVIATADDTEAVRNGCRYFHRALLHPWLGC